MAARDTRTPAIGAGIGALLWLTGLAAPASAQTRPQTGALDLKLEDAILMAVEVAPRMAEARAREAAAATNVTALRALGLPTVNASAQYLRMNHVDEFRIPDGAGGSRVLFPDIPNAYRSRVEVSVPVLSFGRVSTNVAAAEADVHATRADRVTVEADVRLDVMRVYWTLATIRESVAVLEQSLARTDAWVGDVRSRVEAGLLPPNESLTAQAQRARQYVRLLQARNQAALAELDLARLVGVPAGTVIRTTTPVDQPLPLATEMAKAPVADLVSRAVLLRAERESLAARGAGLRQAARASLANLKPYLLALGSVEPSRPNARFVPPIDAWRTSWTMDLKFVVPLFDGGRSKAQAAGLRAQAEALDARRDEFDGLVALEVRQRLLEIEYGREALTASAEAIAAAAEARRVVDERFTAGVATSTEVLDAQVALLEAELERTRLNAELRLSEARLLRALGER